VPRRLERLLRRRVRLEGRNETIDGRKYSDLRLADPRGAVRWIEGEGLFVRLERIGVVVFGVAVVAALEVVAVGLEVSDLLPLADLALTRGQSRRHRLDDPDRDLVLDRKDVCRLAIVPLGPHLIAGLDLGQSSGHPQPVAREPDAALENLAHRKNATDRL
jgi:hypothetical protein